MFHDAGSVLICIAGLRASDPKPPQSTEPTSPARSCGRLLCSSGLPAATPADTGTVPIRQAVPLNQHRKLVAMRCRAIDGHAGGMGSSTARMHHSFLDQLVDGSQRPWQVSVAGPPRCGRARSVLGGMLAVSGLAVAHAGLLAPQGRQQRPHHPPADLHRGCPSALQGAPRSPDTRSQAKTPDAVHFPQRQLSPICTVPKKCPSRTGSGFARGEHVLHCLASAIRLFVLSVAAACLTTACAPLSPGSGGGADAPRPALGDPPAHRRQVLPVQPAAGLHALAAPRAAGRAVDIGADLLPPAWHPSGTLCRLRNLLVDMTLLVISQYGSQGCG